MLMRAAVKRRSHKDHAMVGRIPFRLDESLIAGTAPMRGAHLVITSATRCQQRP